MKKKKKTYLALLSSRQHEMGGKDWNLLDPPFLLLQGYGEEVQH
jgi:hypothetical protein